jgi:hypothetical protein
MNQRAFLEIESGLPLFGNVESLEKTSLCISIDKLNDTNTLIAGDKYYVLIIDTNEKHRLPCRLIKFNSERLYLRPLYSEPEEQLSL